LLVDLKLLNKIVIIHTGNPMAIIGCGSCYLYSSLFYRLLFASRACSSSGMLDGISLSCLVPLLPDSDAPYASNAAYFVYFSVICYYYSTLYSFLSLN